MTKTTTIILFTIILVRNSQKSVQGQGQILANSIGLFLYAVIFVHIFLKHKLQIRNNVFHVNYNLL